MTATQDSHPAIINSQFLYARALHQLVRPGSQWLDLGCGHQFLPTWVGSAHQFRNTGWTLGLDRDAEALRRHEGLNSRILGDVHRLPIASGAFDLVTANMVVEHVVDPLMFFREVARVLKPGGTLLVHTPNVYGYTTILTRCIPSAVRPRLAKVLQNRAEEDVYRTYYRANSVRDLRRMAMSSGFRVEELRTIGSSAQLFRVPIVGRIENAWLRLLASDTFGPFRPCILARFVRASST